MPDLEEFIKYKANPTNELRNEIVEKYLYMVDILIRKYLGKGVDYDDLYQVGALALVQAVERFDPNRGFEFSSFATPTILGEIKKYFRDQQWRLKVPRRLKEIAAKVQTLMEPTHWIKPLMTLVKTGIMLFWRSIRDLMRRDTTGLK